MCERFGVRPKTIEEDAVRVLEGHDWRRNNVRELRNIVERLVLASDDDIVRVEEIPADIRGGAPSAGDGAPRSFQELRSDAERTIVLAALDRHEGHVTRAAEALGLADHASLLKIMRRLGIRRD